MLISVNIFDFFDSINTSAAYNFFSFSRVMKQKKVCLQWQLAKINDPGRVPLFKTKIHIFVLF